MDVLPLVSYGAGMSVHAGRHRLGTDRDRIVLRTFRDGAAAQKLRDAVDMDAGIDLSEPGEAEAGGATGTQP